MAEAVKPPVEYSKLSKAELEGLLGKAKARALELKDEADKSTHSEDQRTAYAQSLIDKLFTTWRDAGNWIKKTHSNGRANAVVFGPTGQPRHLWPYLHASNTVRNAMDRRGPNSIIQGHSSGIGYNATFEIAKEHWHTFGKHDIDIGFHIINMVHDSAPHEVNFVAAPIGIYLIEHGMTTLVMKHYKRVYGMDTLIPHLIDVEMGLNEADLHKWEDQRFDTLKANLEKIGAEGGFSKKDIKNALHNTDEIAKVRIHELKNNPYEMTLSRKTQWYLKHMKGIN